MVAWRLVRITIRSTSHTARHLPPNVTSAISVCKQFVKISLKLIFSKNKQTKGNIMADGSGVATVAINNSIANIALVAGRAVVVHAAEGSFCLFLVFFDILFKKHTHARI